MASPEATSLRAATLTLAASMILTACVGDASPTPQVAPSRSSSPSTGPDDSATQATDPPSAPPTAAGRIDLPEPGRPFDAAAILDAMTTSARPGGVPAPLHDADIAAAVAEQIWTFDGSPWAEVVAGGSCGPQTCTLEIAGTAPGTAGEDLYVFSVTPDSGSVEVIDATLLGIPDELSPLLDELARDVRGDLPGDLVLASASWLTPPDEGRFALAYRSGGEEGSCRLDLVLDVPSAAVISDEAAGC